MAGVAIVFSGGGARGDFELGAVQFLYSTNIRPDILCGTSVGAINAAKLAEGEGAPTQGLQGLVRLWHGLREDGDMYEREAWVNTLPPDLLDAISTGSLDTLGPPAHGYYDSRVPVDAFLQQAMNWAVNNVNDIAWLAGTGQNILKSLQKLFANKAIFNLEPIRRLINGNPAAGSLPPSRPPSSLPGATTGSGSCAWPWSRWRVPSCATSTNGASCWRAMPSRP